MYKHPKNQYAGSTVNCKSLAYLYYLGQIMNGLLLSGVFFIGMLDMEVVLAHIYDMYC
jgi:hypothetical protein